MIHRKADKWIDNHFRNTKKALLLTGARQVGKTIAGSWCEAVCECKGKKNPFAYQITVVDGRNM